MQLAERLHKHLHEIQAYPIELLALWQAYSDIQGPHISPDMLAALVCAVISNHAFGRTGKAANISDYLHFRPAQTSDLQAYLRAGKAK